MENASEALIMGFSILIFVLALTVAVNSFNQAKGVSDIVLYSSDETNYYDYIGQYNPDQGMLKAEGNRYVGLETIIPTLFKYAKENYTVVFKECPKSAYDETTGEFDTTQVEYYTIYKTKTDPKNWGSDRKKKGYLEKTKYGELGSYFKLIAGKYDNSHYDYDLDQYNPEPKIARERLATEDKAKEIFSFDLAEEELRHEPWTAYSTTDSENEQVNLNLKCFLSGDTYNTKGGGVEAPDYGDGFIKIFNEENYKCVETIEKYNPEGAAKEGENALGTDKSTSGVVTKDKTKKMIVFTLIKT